MKVLKFAGNFVTASRGLNGSPGSRNFGRKAGLLRSILCAQRGRSGFSIFPPMFVVFRGRGAGHVRFILQTGYTSFSVGVAAASWFAVVWDQVGATTQLLDSLVSVSLGSVDLDSWVSEGVDLESGSPLIGL